MTKAKFYLYSWVLALVWSADLFAQEVPSPLYLSASATYGIYSESQERDKIISQSISLAYIPTLSNGLGLSLHHSSLTRKSPPSNINGDTANLSYYHFFAVSGGNYIGAKGTLHHVLSDDSNSDGTTIPHLSVTYKPASLLSAFEIGYANTPYVDTTAQQVSMMGAASLFNQWVWSQTRVTYISLSNVIQTKDHTISVEERLTYYIIPSELTLSLYALFGERIYAYDIDLGTAYNVPDIQKGSLGLSLNYNLKDAFSIFADFTQEDYDNRGNLAILDRYRVKYLTAGVLIPF